MSPLVVLLSAALSIPVWVVLLIVVVVLVAAGLDRVAEESRGDWFDLSPLLGCGVLLLGLVGVLLVLLVHAWGWL